MVSTLRSSANIKWLILSLFIASATKAQDSNSGGDQETLIEENSGPDLDGELNSALNITDRQNFVFNSSFVLSSSSCITPDGVKGECKAVSRCSNYTDLASRLDSQSNVDFFRERICRLLHFTVHVCCPAEADASLSEATQSQPLPDPAPETRQRPQDRPQHQPAPQPDQSFGSQPEQTLGRQPDSQPQQPFGRQPDSRPEQPFARQPDSQPEQPFGRQPDKQSPSQPDFQQQPEQPQPEEKPEQLTPGEEPEQQSEQNATVVSSIIPSDAECGLPAGASRIPGDDVQPGNWPWLAAIGRNTVPGNVFIAVCSGTLITRRHILTAAHCFGENNPDVVILGEHHLENDDFSEKPEEYRIIDIKSHDYNASTLENDIAVLTLDRDVAFNDFIQPACLPFNLSNFEFVGDSLTLVGWQMTQLENTEMPLIPLESSVPVIESIQCTVSFQNLTEKISIDSQQLCSASEGRDFCIGDSGGPLNYLDTENGKYYVVGIASYEYECPTSGLPAVYTRVTSFLDWIQENLLKNSW